MMMLMMPVMLVFWLVLIVGIALLVRWMLDAGEVGPATRRRRWARSDAGLAPRGADRSHELPDDTVEREIVAARRQLKELEEQVAWQAKLLAAEPAIRPPAAPPSARPGPHRAGTRKSRQVVP